MVWIQDSVKECCSRCRFQSLTMEYFHLKRSLCLLVFTLLSNSLDFEYASNCNERHLMAVKFFAVSDHCSIKALSEFRIWEDRFDSLDECCRAKFAQSLSYCCEKTGSHGSCILSGLLNYIPVSPVLLLGLFELFASLIKMLTTLKC